MRLLYSIVLVAMLTVASIACNGGDGAAPTTPTYPAGKPTGVTAEAGSRSATISWNSVSNAAGYYVYISSNGIDFQRCPGGLITTTSFSIFTLNNGQIYYFGVSAVGSGGWETSIAYPGGAPNAVPVVPKVTEPGKPGYEGNPPDPPADLQGTAKDSAAELEWSACTTQDFSFYRVYRSTSTYVPYVWTMVANNWTDLEFREVNLNNGQLYRYEVTAVDTENLESLPSNIVKVTPQDFGPEILQNVDIFVNPGRITLEWDIPLDTDIAKYGAERVEGIDPGTGAQIIVRYEIAKPTQTEDNPHVYASGLVKVWVDLERERIVILDNTVVVGTTYTYRLAAIDLAGQEGPPAVITAPIPVP